MIARHGALSDYHLHVLLAPHLGNQGGGNTAWVGEFEGTPLLLAQRNGSALALACSASWIKRSVGYVGSSDGWQDLKAHKKMTWEYTRAENGNVALTAEVDLLGECDGSRAKLNRFFSFGGYGSDSNDRGELARRRYQVCGGGQPQLRRRPAPSGRGGLRHRLAQGRTPPVTPSWGRMEAPRSSSSSYRTSTPHEEMGERWDIAEFNAPFAAAGSDT